MYRSPKCTNFGLGRVSLFADVPKRILTSREFILCYYTYAPVVRPTASELGERDEFSKAPGYKKRNRSKFPPRGGRGVRPISSRTLNFVKIIKNVIFCLLTLNACNFATTGSWAMKILSVSDLGQNSRIFEFPVRIVLLLFEFLESVVGRISRIFTEIKQNHQT